MINICLRCKHFKPHSAENCNIRASLNAFDVRNYTKSTIHDCNKYERDSIEGEGIYKIYSLTKNT